MGRIHQNHKKVVKIFFIVTKLINSTLKTETFLVIPRKIDIPIKFSKSKQNFFPHCGLQQDVTNDVIVKLFPVANRLFFLLCFFSFAEREKQVSIKGDEPTVHQQSRRSLNSQTDANLLSEGINSIKISRINKSEHDVELPCVGRWGNEWPS